MQRTGDQLLAGAGLAGDHHRQVGLHQPGKGPVDLLHGRRAADQRDLVGLFRGCRRDGLGTRQGARDNGNQLLQVEGLGQIFKGAALSGGDGGEQRVLGAHHQDRQIGPHALDAGDLVKAGLIGQDNVGNDEVALACRNPAPQAGGRAGGANIIPGAAQRLVQNGADGAVVIADQNGGRHLSCLQGATAAAAHGKWFCRERSRTQ